MKQYRGFTDSLGVAWKVYRVEPEPVSPTLARLRESMMAPRTERRRPWLLFEASTGERRRLTPVPTEWEENCTEADLAEWCRSADRIPPAHAGGM
jgi:hypothetical protein